MSDTISPSPSTIDLGHTPGVDVWRYPTSPDTADLDNPAAQAREEYNQHQYVEQLARDAAADGVYVDAAGNAIDPQHSEAVLHAAADVVNAYGQSAERHFTPEQYQAALDQAQVYAGRVEDMRDRALIDWGANGDVE